MNLDMIRSGQTFKAIVELAGRVERGQTYTLAPSPVPRRAMVAPQPPRARFDRFGLRLAEVTPDLRVHFGIGVRESIEKVEIRWPDGSLQTLETVPLNVYSRVEQNP